MVTKYIMKRPIMELCEEAVQRPGKWVAKWWEHEGLYMEGERVAAEALDEEEPGEAEGEAEGVVGN